MKPWSTSCRLVAVPAALAGLCALCVVPTSAQTEYNILLTNDDGIESPGIQALAEELRTIGDVLLIAPCGQRSGASMSVALGEPKRLRPVERDGESLGFCVDATPAGAVLLGISMLAPEGGFDLVVSGINQGANTGDFAHMSGTIGGAMMGAFHGVPAVAASFGARSRDFAYAARFVTGFIQEMRSRAPTPGLVFSINVPKATQAETRGVTMAPMGGTYFGIGFEEAQDDEPGRLFQPAFGPPTDIPAGSDTEAYLQDMITITPLRFDWTAHEVIEDLEAWGLSHEVGPGG